MFASHAYENFILLLNNVLSFHFFPFYFEGPGWLNELGSWITYQLIQAYHQQETPFLIRPDFRSTEGGLLLFLKYD
jgi:hypothetical protein